jgi:A/G-specific adenine glycosylase
VLARWYEAHGRHDLPWRRTRDRWAVLVAEVMLQQTQVGRVLHEWPRFVERFPDPATAAAAGPGGLIAQWGRLGYPRRARRLWEAAVVISSSGWPDDLQALPGVGRYTAGAVAAEADGADTVAVDTNVRRVLQRVEGGVLGPAALDAAAVAVAAPLRGRDRLLALMDVGAIVCRPRSPECECCPLAGRCATRGELDGEVRRRQARYEGSLRQRRGEVLATLRGAPAEVAALDPAALESLVADRLVEVSGRRARLARS